MRTTIKDLAKASGVSSATVSYVLNNGPRPVHLKTRERVLEAIRRLNYHPNAVARGLSRRRMNTLGIVSPFDIFPTVNYYFVTVLHGVLRVAMQRKQNTSVFVGSEWADVQHSLPTFTDGRCDGLLLVGVPNNSAIISALTQWDVPFVLLSDVSEEPAVSSVDIDNVGAAEQVTEYLLGLGHRRIALLSGEAEVNSARLRRQGYQQMLAKAGISADPALTPPGGYFEASGYARAMELMRLPEKQRPTALFCGDDEIALGALRALKALGLRVPEDVSVCGFDDIPPAAIADPPLTTVRQPLAQLGERATEILLTQIDENAPGGQKEVLPAELIVRASVACPAFSR